MPTAAQKKQTSHLLLFSSPWPLFNRPSIQLGTLKAYIKQQLPEVDVTAHHFFLLLARNLGYPIYQAVSQHTWLAESIFASLLFPEQRTAAESLFKRKARSVSALKNIDYQHLVRTAAEVTDQFVDTLPDEKSILAGFSISLCQLTASLYMIKRLKERFPKLPIVAGGALVAGKAGEALIQVFPQIDYVVAGEGEIPLINLLKSLQKNSMYDTQNTSRFHQMSIKGNLGPQVISRQLQQLDELPMPDYDDYFALLKDFPSNLRFFPTLSVEASRGCWWQPRTAPKGGSGCAFCNLNLQWQGYRSKSARTVTRQIMRLIQRYHILSVNFTDNALPPAICRTLFARLAALKIDLKLFAEIRAQVSAGIIWQMKCAGMEELQIGIEALSTRLLQRMNKGTHAIDNIQAMKFCETFGIVNASNLLIQFPQSTAAEVNETLSNLDFVLPFRPLRPVRFWLGLESPVSRHHKAYGISMVFNHPHYRDLFPPLLAKQLTFTIQSYRGDIQSQRLLWKPVIEKVKQWQKDHAEMVRQCPGMPLLHFRDGKTFLIIVQRRPDSEPLKHRLTGQSRAIYLFCQQHRSFKRIASKFSSLSHNNIRNFLKTMVTKRLMFAEEDRYLSLAVPLQVRSTVSN